MEENGTGGDRRMADMKETLIKGRYASLTLHNGVITKDISGLVIEKEDVDDAFNSIAFVNRDEPGLRKFYIFESGLTTLFWFVTAKTIVPSIDTFFKGYFVTEANLEDIFAMDTLERDDLEVVKRNVGLKHDVHII